MNNFRYRVLILLLLFIVVLNSFEYIEFSPTRTEHLSTSCMHKTLLKTFHHSITILLSCEYYQCLILSQLFNHVSLLLLNAWGHSMLHCNITHVTLHILHCYITHVTSLHYTCYIVTLHMLHCWLAAVILQEDGEDQEPVEGEIAGFNFTRLSQRFPELKKELKSYKALLSESSNELKPLKVWQMQGNVPVYIVTLFSDITLGWFRMCCKSGMGCTTVPYPSAPRLPAHAITFASLNSSWLLNYMLMLQVNWWRLHWPSAATCSQFAVWAL